MGVGELKEEELTYNLLGIRFTRKDYRSLDKMKAIHMSWGRKRPQLDAQLLNVLEERIRLLEERMLICTTSSVADSGGDWKAARKESVGISSQRDVGPSALSILRYHVTDFWRNISLPGFKYVGEPGRHRSDRFIWIIVLIFSLFVSSEYIGDAYKKWQGSPVLLSFNDSLTPVAVIPYPAITFCPARRISDEQGLQDTLDKCEMDDNCTQHQTDSLSAARLLCPKSEEFQSTELNERYYESSLQEILEEVATSCEDVIEWFKFSTDDYVWIKSNHSACSRYFQTLYGDGSSVCFTFNMLPANQMFKEDVIPPVVDQTILPTKRNWSPDSMLRSANMEQTIPRYIDSNGRWSGLYIGMINFTANSSGVCGEPKTFPKMFFHNPTELPVYQAHESIDLPIHRQLYARITPSLVTASEELDEYTPVNRRCYFSHERSLSLFKIYTQRNCHLECRANCSLSLCDCVPFYLPRINSSIKICGKEHRTSCSPFLITGILEGRFTWRDILRDFKNQTGQRIQEQFKGYETVGEPGKKLTEELLNATYPECLCDCPAACTSLGYDVKIEEGDPLDPSLPEQFARVAISFKELEVTSVLRKELIGLTDFIANSGGVLGVFTGFSFLAMCELVYYLTLRLWSTIKHSWEVTEYGTLVGTSRRETLKCCFCCGPAVAD